MGGAWWLGQHLDKATLSFKYRATSSFKGLVLFVSATWFWAFFFSGYTPKVKIDFSDPITDYWPAAALFFCWGLCDAFVQSYAYWIMGQLSDDPAVLSRYSGFYKCMQSGGAALAWKINGSSMSEMQQLLLNCGLWILSCIYTRRVLKRLISRHVRAHGSELEAGKVVVGAGETDSLCGF
jgi:hypothetical protein